MIILCTGCNEPLPDDALELAGATLRGQCPSCDKRFERPLAVVAEPKQGEPAVSVRFRAPTPRPDSTTLEEAAPAEACPKCDEPAPPGDADCRRCGLARARFSSFAASSEAGASPALRRAWRAVEDDWSDDGAHERFVELAAAESAFAFAARCYRRADKVRQCERAAAQLARIQRMAEVTFLATTKSARPGRAEPEPYRGVVAMLLALLALAGVAGLYVMWRGSTSAKAAPAEAPAAVTPAPTPETPFFRPPPQQGQAPAADAQPARP